VGGVGGKHVSPFGDNPIVAGQTWTCHVPGCDSSADGGPKEFPVNKQQNANVVNHLRAHGKKIPLSEKRRKYTDKNQAEKGVLLVVCVLCVCVSLICGVCLASMCVTNMWRVLLRWARRGRGE